MPGLSKKTVVTALFCLCFAVMSGEEKTAPVPASAVHLSGGPFLHARELDRAWLRSLDMDRFLSGFRTESGLESNVPRYGGWEAMGVSGHAFGHFLCAASNLVSTTADNDLLGKLDYCMDVLAQCQEADGTGLLCAFEGSRRIFDELRRGDIRAQGFDLNGGWVPMYTVHKVLAGLISVTRLTPEPTSAKARSVLLSFADYLAALFEGLDDTQIQTILFCEHGGLQESFLDIYSLTGDTRYLTLAKRLEHRIFLEPLEHGEDRLCGEHANMEIPKIVSLAREYEATGEERCLQTARFFWDRVTGHHSYVIGGNSEGEHFGQPDHLEGRLDGGTCETCNTYNMLKLTAMLHRYNPSARLADYYERAVLNQILASQNPETGMVCYMSPLGAGQRKDFSTPFDSFWCCVGTGFENHTRYEDFIYSAGEKSLYVNLFIPSELSLPEKGIALKQETGFPYDSSVNFTVRSRGRFTLYLRRPSWSSGTPAVTVNGKNIRCSEKNGYLELSRKWKPGDKVTLTLNPAIHHESLPGDSSLKAWMYGPVVLCAHKDSQISVEGASAPVIISADTLDFCLESTGGPVALRPYFEAADNPTVVYFKYTNNF